MNNCKQFANTWMQYSNDYGQLYPSLLNGKGWPVDSVSKNWAENASKSRYWGGSLDTEPKMYQDKTSGFRTPLLECPTARAKGKGIRYNAFAIRNCYAYNFFFNPRTKTGSLATPETSLVKLSQIRTPGKALLLCDDWVSPSSAQTARGEFSTDGDSSKGAAQAFSWVGSGAGTSTGAKGAHGTNANMAYADGHVAASRTFLVFDGSKSGRYVPAPWRTDKEIKEVMW